MALKPKSRIANNLVKPENGIYTGTIVNADYVVRLQTEKKGRDRDDYEKTFFEIDVEFAGTVSPIIIKIMTSDYFDPEPKTIVNEGRGKKNEIPVYNRYVRALMQFKLVTLETLNEVDENELLRIESDLPKLKGKKIECIVGKNKDGYFAIDLDSVKLL